VRREECPDYQRWLESYLVFVLEIPSFSSQENLPRFLLSHLEIRLTTREAGF
jgi:hypothetical protein